MKIFLSLCAALSVAATSNAVRSGQITIEAEKDNTLYFTEDGSLSNGAGQYLFAGNTAAGVPGRAVLAFDIAGNIPPGSTIDGVVLTLEMSLHRLTRDWGEGASVAPAPEGGGGDSEPGDATWINTFYPDEFWDTPGGDFVPGAGAVQEVGGVGSYTWSSPMPAAGAGISDMTSDVQSWLDDPSTDYGWILIGDEADPRTRKRFDSRHNSAAPPALVVDFTPPVSDCIGDCSNLGAVTVADVMTGVNIVLGILPVSACPAFAVDGVVTILQLIQGVNNLLNGCPGSFIDVVSAFGQRSRLPHLAPVLAGEEARA